MCLNDADRYDFIGCKGTFLDTEFGVERCYCTADLCNASTPGRQSWMVVVVVSLILLIFSRRV